MRHTHVVVKIVVVRELVRHLCEDKREGLQRGWGGSEKKGERAKDGIVF